MKIERGRGESRRRIMGYENERRKKRKMKECKWKMIKRSRRKI